MRILFSSYTFSFQNPGGGEIVLQSLERELVEMGHTVDRFSPWKHGSKEIEGYDLVHYFSTLETDFWKWIKNVAHDTPLVVTPTLFQNRSTLNTLKLLRRRWAERLLTDGYAFDLPDLWLPTTSRERDGLVKDWGVDKQKTEVLENGVDSRYLDADPRLFAEEYKISGQYLLHVGRFHPVKNHLTLIRAVRDLGLSVVFLGGAEPDQTDYYKECRRLARGSSKFYFIDRISHSDPLLASAYKGASLFVLPSFFETFGLAALEAAVAGCPLVLTNGMESRDVFEPISTFVDPKNEAEMAAAILRTMSGQRLPRHVSEDLVAKFGWKAVARKLAGFYEEKFGP